MKFSRLTLVNLLIGALILASPFVIQMTSSSRYDPWADLDEDGDVDIYDIVDIAGRYGTKGNSTREVNVVSLPVHSTVIVADYVFVDTGTFTSPVYNAQGFGKIHVMIYVQSIAAQEAFDFEIHGHVGGGLSWSVYSAPLIQGFDHMAFTINVPSENFTFVLNPEGTSNGFLDLSFYLTWA